MVDRNYERKEEEQNSKPGTSRVSRRATLELAGGAISLGAVRTVSGRTTGETRTIVTHRAREKPAKKKEVPIKWYDHIQAAKKAKSNLINRFQNNSAVIAGGLTASNNYYDGKRGFAISIEVEEDASVRDRIPESVDGIPVIIRSPIDAVESDGCDELNACVNEDVYNPTPGGVTFDGATAGSSFYVDDNGDGSYDTSLMLSCGHCVGDGDPCDGFNSSTTVSQHCEDWGSLYKGDGKRGVVLLEPNTNHDVTDKIQAADGTEHPIAGYMTESGIADKCSTGDLVQKTGIMTSDQHGQIKRYDFGNLTDCRKWYGEGVEVAVGATAGDSGGPMYDVQDGDAYMVAVLSVNGAVGDIYDYDCNGNPAYGECYGTAAYEVRRHFDGYYRSDVPYF